MTAERFYANIINNAPIAYSLTKLIYDASGNLIDLELIEVNPAFETMTGLKREQAAGSRVSQFFPHTTEWLPICTDLIKQREPRSREIYSPILNRWYKGCIYSPVSDRIISLFYDITDTKRISEEKSTLLSSLYDIIFELNHDYKVIKLYSHDDTVLLRPREEIIGNKLPDLLEEDLAGRFLIVCQEAARTGMPTVLEYQADLKGRKNWFRATIVPVEKSFSIKYRVTVRNINEQKMAEDHLKTFFMVSSEYMCITDREGYLLDANQAILNDLGIEATEVTGRHFTEFVHPQDVEVVQAAFPGLLITGINRDLIHRFGYREKWRYIEWQSTILDGRMYFAGRDITARIEAEHELQRDNARLQRLVEVLEQPFNTYDELINFALEQGTIMTGSSMGSFYRYDEQRNELILIAHSQNVKELCRVKDHVQKIYPVTTSGIWTSTVSSKMPFYMNDYPTNPLKRGYPVGHVDIKRFLSVPVMGSNRLAAVVLMANKESDYTDKDALQLTLFMNAVWRAGQRKRAELALNQEKEKIRVTLESIGEGVISTDQEGRVVMLNQIAEELTGWESGEAHGKPLTEVFFAGDLPDRKPYSNPALEVVDTGKILRVTKPVALVSRSGRERLVVYSASPIRGESELLLGAVLVFRDVTIENKKMQRIIYLSQHDKLTGLYNREFAEQELVRLNDETNLPLTIVMGDLNALKLTNDVFGHEAGDRLLIKTTKILKAVCRENDIIARWGGDEFIIIMPETDNVEANLVCEQIRASFADMDTSPGGIALGYATKEDLSRESSEVLKEAEDYMYKRKLLESKSLRSSIISSITRTLDEKSHETEAHASRLREGCKNVGAAMGLREHQINELELLSMLHDIGKIAVDDHILNKPGPLNDEERKVMQKHPEIGYRITQMVPELSVVADYILCHHERWDGEGYPQGLAGGSIPLLARILTVVDAYDAMTNDRPYRQALSREQAAAELVKEAGKQFDPEVVDIFLGIIS